MTKKRDEFQLACNKLFFDLLERRAKGVCEIKGKGCWWRSGLKLHHIFRRSDPANCENTPQKTLIGCPVCHSHANFHTGIKGYDGKAMSIEDQLKLAEKLNRRYGIE